jgi:glutathione S-transferase
MTFTLYNAPQSTCSQRVRFVLNAKGLSFEEIKLDLLAGDQLKPDYLALNPNGVVPTLDHDGAIVLDSSVIIEYLDEVVPTPESFSPAIRSCAQECAHSCASSTKCQPRRCACQPSTWPSCRALPL